MNSKKRVLIAPLNWGLGHASRCVPIINYLISQNFEIVIAAHGNALLFLKQEFPNEKILPLEDNKMQYFKKTPAWLSIFFQLPFLIINIVKEKKLIQKIVNEQNINVIISDNRYGLRTKSTLNILISHQLNVDAGILSFIPNAIIHSFVSKFDYCLIPDSQNFEDSLAGKLSHPKKTMLNKVRFIGPISRYQKTNSTQKNTIPVLISGPEPLKSKLIENLIIHLKKSSFSYVLLCGNAENFSSQTYDNIIIKNHDSTQNINKMLNEAALVVASGGYSSLMDMYCLDKKSILIPFHGQTEQEYLAKFHEKSKKFTFVKMKEIESLDFAWDSMIKDRLSNNEESAYINQSSIPQFQDVISQILKQ